MDLTKLEEVRLQVGRLIEYELFNSAENILQLSLAKTRSDPNSKAIQTMCYDLLGDICYKRTEYRRALTQYSQALQQLRFSKRPSSSSSSSTSSSFSQLSVNTIRSQEEADLKHKCCKCNMMLADYTAAIKDLDVIPHSMRSVAINISLYKLYKKVNLKNPEANVIKAVLKEFPVALELITDLINLDEPVEKIKEVISPVAAAGSWLDDLTGMTQLQRSIVYLCIN
jgi:hypothetical protein